MQRVIQRYALIAWNAELVSGAADVAHPRRSRPRVADVDFPCGGKGKVLAGKVVRGNALEELARFRSHDRDHRECAGHVDQSRKLILGDVLADPVGVARRLRGAGQDEKRVRCGAGDRKVALEAPAFVQHCRIHHTAGRHIQIAGTKALQHREGVAAFEHQLRKRGLVEHHDLFSRGTLFVEHEGQPAGPIERRRRLGETPGQKIIGAFPVQLGAENRTFDLQPVIER